MASRAAAALNDEEVHAEMRKMVAFISQEAMEKAREIRVKADEEFNIEKAKLVRSEAIHIENSFTKKVKQSSVQRKICQSMYINKTRLRVLQCRQELLDELFEEATVQLASILDDTNSYAGLLEKLTLQCLLSLMDTDVIIKCRLQDQTLAVAAIERASFEYKKLTKRDIKVALDESRFLPDSTCGGVVAASLNGKITCDNTLHRRLELLSEIMLPEIRKLVLGVSENRKFFD